MSSLEFRDVGDLCRDRLDDRRSAWHLDHLSTGWGARPGAVVGGLVVGVMSLWLGSETALLGALIAPSGVLVSMPWQVDEAEGGARLRQVVGLTRSSVLRARYVDIGVMGALFFGTAVLVRLIAEVVAGDAGAWALTAYAWWMSACVAVLVVCVTVPVRVRFGNVATWLAVGATSFVGVLLALGAGSVWFGGEAIDTVVGAVGALGGLVALTVVGGLASYRTARRIYDGKDL